MSTAVPQHIAELEREGRFTDAAILLFNLAQQSSNREWFERAAQLFFLGSQHDLAHQLVTALVAAVGSSPSLARLHALVLFEQGHIEQALLQLRSLEGRSEDWVQELVDRRVNWNRRALAQNKIFRTLPSRAYALSTKNVLEIIFEVPCRSCGRQFTHKLMRTLWQLVLSPCPSCLRPHLVTPVDLATKLEEGTSGALHDEMLAVERTMYSWSSSWWKYDTPPAEAFITQDKNLYEMLFFTMRWSLGDAYSRLFNEFRRGIKPPS